jgi:hypothetical protein
MGTPLSLTLIVLVLLAIYTQIRKRDDETRRKDAARAARNRAAVKRFFGLGKD